MNIDYDILNPTDGATLEFTADASGDHWTSGHTPVRIHMRPGTEFHTLFDSLAQRVVDGFTGAVTIVLQGRKVTLDRSIWRPMIDVLMDWYEAQRAVLDDLFTDMSFTLNAVTH